MPLSTSVATALEMVAEVVLMRRWLHVLHGRRVLRWGGQAAIAAGAMSLALWAWLHLTNGKSAWIAGGGGIVTGGVVYRVGILLLGVKEVGQVIRAVKARLFRG
ncbi:MAG: hypothetical protein KJ638_07660 [Chloroflexi bacterium]|nr:hypothetical protein [Chloroflexota bacterium]